MDLDKLRALVELSRLGTMTAVAGSTGYGTSAISQQLDPQELSALVQRFEQHAFDTVAEEGGRVVKTIGDEVMFVGLVNEAVAAALALRDSAATAATSTARNRCPCGNSSSPAATSSPTERTCW